MPQVTIHDLFAKIGQLTVENEAINAENTLLRDALTRKEEDHDTDATSKGDVPSGSTLHEG